MDNSALTSAGLWIAHLMSGQLATTVAILGIAALGLAMLAGQIRWRRGVEVILGAFVIVGASNLANGALVPWSTDAIEPRTPVAFPAVSFPPPPPAVYDPYAGASVPTTLPPTDLTAPRS